MNIHNLLATLADGVERVGSIAVDISPPKK